MQALLAIVQSQDADAVLERLKAFNLPCLVRIASSGGFLQESNTTLWIAVRPGQLGYVLNVLRTTCQQRTAYIPAYYIEAAPLISVFPTEVAVGGATVFVCDIERYEVF